MLSDFAQRKTNPKSEMTPCQAANKHLCICGALQRHTMFTIPVKMGLDIDTVTIMQTLTADNRNTKSASKYKSIN